MSAVTESETDAPSPIVNVIGVTDEGGVVRLTSVARVNAHRSPGVGLITDLVVALVDADGQQIASGRAYAPLAHGHTNELAMPPFTFVATLPDARGGAALVVTRGSREVFHREAPREPSLENFRATVTEDGDAVDLSWDFEAFSDVEPEFWLQASTDGGDSWNGVTTDLNGSTATVDLSAVPSGSVLLRLLGHDGFTTVSALTRIRLPRQGPTATILHPADHATFTGPGPIRLWGIGISADDGALKGDALSWSSDLDGSLPAGPDVLTSLAPGRHQITLLVTDSANLSAEAHVSVAVLRPQLACLDLGADPPAAPGVGFHPPGLLVSGCRFDVYGQGFTSMDGVADGVPIDYDFPEAPSGPHTLIKARDNFTGLDCGFGLQITLAYPVPYVELSFVCFVELATVEAYDVNGEVIGSVTAGAANGTAQTLAFHGIALSRIVITPQNPETLLLSVCF